MTDQKLASLEKEVQETYDRAVREMDAKLKKLMEDYDQKNKKFLSDIKTGDVNEEEYQRFLRGMAYNKHFTQDMLEVLTEDLYNYNAIAAEMIRNSVPSVYALNANYAAFQIDKQVGFMTSFRLYNPDTVARLIRDKPVLLPIRNPHTIPKVTVKKNRDKAWNMRKIRNEITQGILQGESVQDMAKRLERVVGMNKKSAITNARTATTSAQNGGRMDTYQRANEDGIAVKKSWLATMDVTTRPAHRLLDGQIQPVDKPFQSEFGPIMQPGDPNARPENVYNCRCRVVGVLKEEYYNPKDLSKRFTRLPSGTTYEEWQNMKVREEEDDE